MTSPAFQPLPSPEQQAQPNRTAYPPKQAYGWQGGLLSVLVHGLLLLMLLVGVQWNIRTPPAMQAELWTSLPGPQPSAEPPVTAPAPPEPKAVEPKPIEEPPKAKPDIALPDKKKPEPPPKQKPEPKPDPKHEPKPTKKDVKPSKDELKEQERQQREEKKREQAHEAELKKLRDEELRRTLASATGGNTASDSSNAAGQDPGYKDKIRARILNNIVFNTHSESGNPEAVFLVEQLPTGEITAIRKLRSSGVPGWDDAVERALNKSSPLPRAKDGSVVRQLELTFRPRDVR